MKLKAKVYITLLVFWAGIIALAVILVLPNHRSRNSASGKMVTPLRSKSSLAKSDSADTAGADIDQTMLSNTALHDKSRIAEPAVTNRIDAVKQSDNSLDVIVDDRLRHHARLSPDGRTLSLLDQSGNTIWSNDVIHEMGVMVPLYYHGRIDSMYVYGDFLVLLAGSGYYEIDKRTGKMARCGER